MKKTCSQFITTLFALAALNAAADITFDTASSGTAGTAATVAWSHVVGDSGPDRMLVVGVAAERVSSPFPTGVTYGSQALTKVAGSSAAQNPGVVGNTNATELWYLPAPAVGTNTITVTFATSVANGMECGAVSLFGVNQTAPEAVAIANGASSGTAYSLAITTLTDKAWLVDVVNSGAGGGSFTTTTAGMTERWDRNVGGQLVGAGATREVSPAGTVTDTWTSTGSSRRAQSIAAFAPAPPSPVAVAITSPTNSAVVSSTSFSINANATVNPGTVTNVDFYLDGALVGSDASYPFSFAVGGAAAGAHALQAVATDSGGIMATSAVVNVTAANLPPTVALTSPANGSPALVGASVALAATATDDSAVTNVDFYLDGALVGSDSSNPYNATWASATLGAHTLTAVASDDGGLSTTSAVVNITGYSSFAAYEPFNYTSLPNGTASTASGFTGNWTCGATPSIVSGMTYPALPVTNSALSSTAGRQSVNFLAPLAGGTEYVSFLFTQVGNNGANYCGVYFLNGGTGLFFGYGFAPGGSSGAMGLGSMNTVGTAVQPASPLAISFTGVYGTTYLVVMKIDFNTSGANDTVTVYINPTANSPTPPAATYTVSSFDVGTIAGIGLTQQGGGQAIRVDEIRRGSTFGEVVGYNPPATPAGLVATAGVNSVSLSWNVASGATGYNVLRGTSTGVYTVTNSAASNTNYDATAVGGTQYFYVVQATNASGLSTNSSEVTATPTIALPNVPAGLAAIGTNGAVNLSWNVAVGAASYNVKRSTTSNTEVTISNVVATSYVDTDVINGTAYFYKVSSTNAAGESANSSEVTATPNVPPAAPTGLIATAGTNQVALSWTSSPGAASYNIKRSTTSGSGYVTIGTTTAPTVSYTDSTAVKFVQYYYVVSAVNAYGESPDSSPEATATPTGTYAPTAYEPFNYGALANNDATTASGFTGNWTIGGSASIISNLTYPSLPTVNNAFQQLPGGQRDQVSLASPLSSGTKFISFLYNQAGDNGGNRNGLYLPGSGATSLFVGPYPWSGVAGVLTLSTVITASGSATGTGVTLAQMPGPTQLFNYNQTNLIVIRIDFNTSGANDTVSLWLNPTAGTLAPAGNINAPNPDLVVTSYDVGTISGIGFNFQGGGAVEQFDEFRVGDTFGDVSGYGVSSVNTTPTNIVSSISGNQLTLSWPADRTGWKLQSQTNDLNTGISGTWFDVAGSTTTNEMTFTIDPANPTVFYRMMYP